MKPHEIQIIVTHGAERLDAVRQLRYEVLRRPLKMPFEETLFAGDELPSTQHWIALLGDTPVGCLTLLMPDSTKIVSADSRIPVQLRGMAVSRQLQSKGIGGRLLTEVHKLAVRDAWHLWCNARETAVPFYARNGWCVQGPRFDIPRIGTHFAMSWEPRE